MTLVVSCFFLACNGNDKSSEVNSKTNPISESNENAIGEKVYRAKCKLCHGTDGQLGLTGAANLSISALSAEETIEVIRNGRNTMKAYKDELTKEEIIAVANYIEKF